MASDALNRGRLGDRSIQSLSVVYRQRRLRLLSRIMCLASDDFRRTAIFSSPRFHIRSLLHLRSGRPRYKWTIDSMEDLWRQACHRRPEHRHS
eukprot:425855-Prorocentrum_lima.AAC.1